MSDTPRTDAAAVSREFIAREMDYYAHKFVLVDHARQLERELSQEKAELERERMRLAACGVVARADTLESAAKAREMRADYRSASCDDVARRVDECILLRAKLTVAMKALHYCAIEPGYLLPANNAQHAVAMNALSEIEEMAK